MENRFEKEGFHATSRIKKNDEKKNKYDTLIHPDEIC